MKRFTHDITVFVLGISLSFSIGCKKAENIRTTLPKPEKNLAGIQGKLIQLFRDTVYILSEPLIRNNGEQLVIEAGTLIKANPAMANSIIIHTGAIIQAQGTATEPIVLTSNAGTGTQYLNWGGIIINGRSVVNSTSQTADPQDFSGSLNYVRIEFAGLVLNGIGNRTNIEHVQVSYAIPQSSYEIHGGTFNAKYLVSYACGGPADFYITKGYSGRIQHLLAYRHPFFGKNGTNPTNALAGIYIENSPFNFINARPYTYPIISNATVIGPNEQNGSSPSYIDSNLRSGALVAAGSTGFRIRNSLLFGFPRAEFFIDDTLTAYGLHHLLSEFAYSIVQRNHNANPFFLRPNVYRPYSSVDFMDFMMEQRFGNKMFKHVDDFMLEDPFNYESPKPWPKEHSPVLKGANFGGADFSNFFFDKVMHLGAIGQDNWLSGWTNFIPLKTDYNSPR